MNQNNFPAQNGANLTEDLGNMDDIMKKAQDLSEILAELRLKTEQKKDGDVLVGTSPDDKVKVVANGHLDVKAFKIAPNFEAQIIERMTSAMSGQPNAENIKGLMKDQLNYVMDMCVAAINDLIRKYWDYQNKISDDAAGVVAKAIEVPKEVVRPMVMIATDTNSTI